MRRLVRCPRLLVPLVLGAALHMSCGAGSDVPTIEAVRPGSVAPGGMVLLSGRGFARADGVWVAGRELANVSWVNGGLLATTLPADLPEGSHTLEVRSPGGRRASVSVQVAAPLPAASENTAGAPPTQAVPAPAPSTTPQPAPEPPHPPSVQGPADPPRGDDKDDKDDDKKDNGRGNGNQGNGNGGRGGRGR
jgi:hypothetical protein